MKTKELKEEIEKLEKYMAKNLFYESYLDNRLDCLKAELKGRTEALKDVEKMIEKTIKSWDDYTMGNILDSDIEELKQKIKEMDK